MEAKVAQKVWRGGGGGVARLASCSRRRLGWSVWRWPRAGGSLTPTVASCSGRPVESLCSDVYDSVSFASVGRSLLGACALQGGGSWGV